MRMWMIDPKLMCRQHLLGEHNEIHKFRPSFVKKHNMAKRILLGQIDPWKMKERHDELVVEMVHRGYNHLSPYELPDLSYIEIEHSHLDIDANIQDLMNRCPECRKRIMEKYNEQNKSTI